AKPPPLRDDPAAPHQHEQMNHAHGHQTLQRDRAAGAAISGVPFGHVLVPHWRLHIESFEGQEAGKRYLAGPTAGPMVASGNRSFATDWTDGRVETLSSHSATGVGRGNPSAGNWATCGNMAMSAKVNS